MNSTNSTDRSNYGWIILAVATFALIVGNGLSIGGIPVFYKAIREEFVADGLVAVQRAESFIADGANITFLMSGVFSMLGGWLIKRYSLRFLMILGCIALGVGLLLHSQAESVAAVYAARFLMGMSLGFVGVTPSVVLVSGWFRRNRGTALGILLTGTSIGGVVIPFIAAPLITRFGWRAAMAALSVLVWLVLLPAVILLVRENRENEPRPENAEAKEITGYMLSEAVRMPVFWVFGACAALVFYPIFATSQQFILYLQTPRIGMSLESAALAQSALFGVSVGGKFLAGWLSDRWRPSVVMLGCTMTMFAATLVLFDLNVGNALPFLMTFGLGYGGTFVLLQRMAADIFGMKEYGKILGTITMIEIIGAAVGGRITGYLADEAGGDYVFAFYGVIAAAAAAFVCVALLNVMVRHRFGAFKN